uniref:RING-type domain-containing protein n=1 Tax=Amphilophus citrinellus TaxID=61819 RepID=A0A3Q0SGL8_AMPCI
MQMANLVDADVSEEDKIKAMINQSFPSLKLSSCVHISSMCFGQQDKNNEVPLRIKKSTGIPRSFMVEVDDPNMKGAKLTNCGRYAIPAIDAVAYAIGKKEKPPFLPNEQPESEHEDDPIPSELLCLICNELLTDAVVIPCCGNSYCDECIRTALLESEYHICPICDQSEVSPDTLIANKFLRQIVIFEDVYILQSYKIALRLLFR